MNRELFNRAYVKAAGAIADAASSEVYEQLGTLGLEPLGLASSTGKLVGLLSNPATKKELKLYRDTPSFGFIPGVGGYRKHKRLKADLTNKKGKRPHYWSQVIGKNLTSPLISGGLGALAGAALSDEDYRPVGAWIGAGVGAGITGLAAALAALIKKRRNKKQHEKYLESSSIPEYLVPGLAAYNQYKTVGYAEGDK